jgi:hypothetical protein
MRKYNGYEEYLKLNHSLTYQFKKKHKIKYFIYKILGTIKDTTYNGLMYTIKNR